MRGGARAHGEWCMRAEGKVKVKVREVLAIMILAASDHGARLRNIDFWASRR